MECLNCGEINWTGDKSQMPVQAVLTGMENSATVIIVKKSILVMSVQSVKGINNVRHANDFIPMSYLWTIQPRPNQR